MASKKRSSRVLLVVLGVLAGLIIGEVAIRIAFPSYLNLMKVYRYKESERGKFTRYDPLLGWAGKENVRDYFQWVDCRHYVEQNRFGYRGPEYGFERTQGRRILVLGDSFVWGFGVENPEIFTSIMDRRGGAGLEVVNMGVSGYGNDQEYLLWRKEGYKWRPDIVVLMLTPATDLWENSFTTAHGYPKPVLGKDRNGKLLLGNVPVPRRKQSWDTGREISRVGRVGVLGELGAHSALLGLVVTAASKHQAMRDLLSDWGMIPERVADRGYEPPMYMTSLNKKMEMRYSLMLMIVDSLHDNVKLAGAEFAVVIVPSELQVYPELWSRFLESAEIPEGARLDPLVPNRLILEHLREKGIKVIDLLPQLERAGAKNPYLYYPVNGHWTREGHVLVAETIQKGLGLK